MFISLALKPIWTLARHLSYRTGSFKNKPQAPRSTFARMWVGCNSSNLLPSALWQSCFCFCVLSPPLLLLWPLRLMHHFICFFRNPVSFSYPISWLTYFLLSPLFLYRVPHLARDSYLDLKDNYALRAALEEPQFQSWIRILIRLGHIILSQNRNLISRFHVQWLAHLPYAKKIPGSIASAITKLL